MTILFKRSYKKQYVVCPSRCDMEKVFGKSKCFMAERQRTSYLVVPHSALSPEETNKHKRDLSNLCGTYYTDSSVHRH